jgi:hypothetical protein
MSSLDSPQRQERRDNRYPLHLPVSVKLAHKEVHAHSENISLRGILLSSAFLIPEGSTVEVAVGVAHLPDPGIQLSARGKVLRVQPKVSGNFAVAIALERPFGFGRQRLDSDSGSQAKGPQSPQEINKVVTDWRLHFAQAWHTET